MKAIIIVVGMCKHLRPLTLNKPICAFEVGGTTIIENTINQFKKLGIEEIGVVVGFLSDQFTFFYALKSH